MKRNVTLGSTKIVFNKNIKRETVKELTRYFTKYQWLLPGWLQEIVVSVYYSSPNDEGAIASVRINEVYRHAFLNVYSSWLAETQAIQEDAFIHELIHLHVNKIAKTAIDVVKESVKPEETQLIRLLEKQIDDAHESATQDLARLIYIKCN